MAISMQAVFAEFFAMMFFVFFCAGSAATTGASNPLQVALSFGFCITALAYTIGHKSGGHINCAVTLGLVIVGACSPRQGAADFGAQMVGAITGAILVAICVEDMNDQTSTLGINVISPTVGVGSALVGEFVCTFFLMYVVLQTACNPRTASNRSFAPFAIGLAVYLAHSFLIPIDGCSINPTRSFGPAVVATLFGRLNEPTDSHAKDNVWADQWVFWVGPLAGSACAAILFKFIEGEEIEKAFSAWREEGIEKEGIEKEDIEG